MRLEALVRAAPAHLANLSRGQGPAREAVEGLPQGVDGRVVHEVHEGVAEVGLAVEVAGQVDEVVAPGKAMLVQHGQEHVTIIIIGNVPQHHGGALASRVLGILLCRHLRWLRDWLRRCCRQRRLTSSLRHLSTFVAESTWVVRLLLGKGSHQERISHRSAQLPVALHQASAIIHIDERTPHNHVAWALLVFARVSRTTRARRCDFRRARVLDTFNVAVLIRHSAFHITVTVCMLQFRNSKKSRGRCQAGHGNEGLDKTLTVALFDDFKS
mmetsp:Transcript_23827/g.48968  ORF Transcript_23827/g.48968 Transcript_23827/m.48968 type:complete len:270 (-) Transcript_23827:23-832(-)